ncbi:MAG: relaxase/mobilization nuclease domain-containing protein, partial [Mangrovibacterium sp.]
EDIEREHIHIVSLRVKSDGGKVNDSQEFIRSKRITEELEAKHRLQPGEGKALREDWRLSSVDTASGNIKRQISQVAKAVAGSYYFQSLGEYKAILSRYHVEVEEVRGERNGTAYRGLLYQATNVMGIKVGVPIKSSLIGKAVGLEALEKRMTKSQIAIKQKGLKTHTWQAVSAAKSQAKTESEFRALLAQDKIEVLFRKNDEGRIYGATFIDHHTRCALNGSRLGKGFSANVFQEMWGEKVVSPSKLGDSENPLARSLQEDYKDVSSFSLLPDVDEEVKPEAELYQRKRKKRRFGRQGD